MLQLASDPATKRNDPVDERYSTDWWLWQMNRLVATYINEPNAANEQRLRNLMERYRSYRAYQPSHAEGPRSDFSNPTTAA